MSSPGKRNGPRPLLKAAKPDRMAAATVAVMGEVFGAVIIGFQEARERAMAAMPGHMTEAEREAVGAEILKCYGATIGAIIQAVGGQAISADKTAEGKIARFAALQALLKSTGFEGTLEEGVDFLCRGNKH